jgi:hypothetical protein
VRPPNRRNAWADQRGRECICDGPDPRRKIAFLRSGGAYCGTARRSYAGDTFNVVFNGGGSNGVNGLELTDITFAVNVPEPMGLGFVALSALVLLGRRRKESSGGEEKGSFIKAPFRFPDAAAASLTVRSQSGRRRG